MSTLRLALFALLTLLAPSLAEAQHALPIDALPSGELVVRAVRVPDSDALPVRVVLGDAQAPRFLVDVWVTSSSADATALLAARLDTLSTRGLAVRSGIPHAWATNASGASTLVALVVENVVLVVRATGEEDAIPLASRLASAVLASAPTAQSSLARPAPLRDVLTIQEPSDALDFRVTCEGACEARRVDRAFRVERTGDGDATPTIHVVDGFLRARHVR